MEDWLQKQATRKNDAITSIKNLIRPFTQLKPAPKGYIAVEFDGYGDSGDIQTAEYVKSVKHPKEQEPSIQESDYEKITELCYDLLPGGWEINSGSFGVIKISFDKDVTIKVENNERYESSDYSEEEY